MGTTDVGCLGCDVSGFWSFADKSTEEKNARCFLCDDVAPCRDAAAGSCKFDVKRCDSERG